MAAKRLEARMAAHKYKVGQSVSFAPARTSMSASSREYKIVRLLPPENGQPQYRIKGISEVYERTAFETELTRRM